MILRQASANDTNELMKLRLEAETWLAEAGIDQWRNPATRGRALAKWEADIAAGRTWVVLDPSGAVAATVTLAAPDADFWRPSDSPANAVYIAKLITARHAAGHKLGGRILDWAGRVALQQGLGWVRLDCWRSNVQLQEYYLSEGFEHVRTEAPPHRLSGWLAQRPSAVQAHPDDRLHSTTCRNQHAA